LTPQNNQNSSVRQEVAQKFVDGLYSRKSPLLRPLDPGLYSPPVNLATGNTFSGINRVILAGTGQPDPRWMTKKQVEDNGYQINESTSPQKLIYWDDKSGDRPVMRFYSVYNARDLRTPAGHSLPLPERKITEQASEQRAEAIMANSGARIIANPELDAGYDLSDIISLPSKERMGTRDYYSEAMRQIINRASMKARVEAQAGNNIRPLSPDDDATEKLKTHLAYFMVTQDLGLKFVPDLKSHTVSSWKEQLTKNPDMLFQAAKQAEKLRAQVLGLEKSAELGVAAPEPVHEAEPNIAQEKTVLQVPYSEKDRAKAAGARWDREQKVWTAEAGTDLSKLAQWLPENEPEPSPNLTPELEFAEILSRAGFKLGDVPVMDGSIQRVPVDGGKPNSKDGAYQARMDGDRPNGWFKNHKSGEYQAWMYTGQTLSEDQKSQARQSQADERREALEKAEKRVFARWVNGIDVEKEFADQIEDMVPIQELMKNPFLEVAGVNPYGVRRDDDGNLMIPCVNKDGRLLNLQTISPTGEATFEKGCRREGIMCLIDSGNDISEPGRNHGFHQLKKDAELEPDRSILIAEDYATGASIHMSTGQPVAVAFYPANMISVAKTMREKFPEANLVVCANDSPGRYLNNSFHQAMEAASAANAHLIRPTFSDTEREQGLTSFNDLHKYYGAEGVARDLAPALRKVTEQQTDKGRGR
jgi:phage/plasmid primase-like uncharacterized protein/antirestriction protein ArdC